MLQIRNSRNSDLLPVEGWDLNDHCDVVGDACFQQFSFGTFLLKNKRLVDLGHADDAGTDHALGASTHNGSAFQT